MAAVVVAAVAVASEIVLVVIGLVFVVLVAVDIVAAVVEVMLVDNLQDPPHHQVLCPGRYRKKVVVRSPHSLLSVLQ